MELNISDLLDSLPEVDVDIRPHTAASERRIKELTMNKIHAHGTNQQKRNGFGMVKKVLAAAAAIAVLAVPVFAASRAQFTDWIEGIITPRDLHDDYENSLLNGSQSKKWEVSGWVLDISAEDASPTGLTFVCKELGSPDKSGTLTSRDGYWLEKWDGSAYVPMEGSAPASEPLIITHGSTERWQIDWTAVYGELESGSYRIGKIFTYTGEDHVVEQKKFYAKFRIFSQDMTPLMEQFDRAFDALYNRESYHLSYTNYSSNKDDYAHHYVKDLWKHGDDYLYIISYYNEDGSLKSHLGAMLRDGLGYELSWVDGNIHGQVSQWNSADWVEPSSFTLWYTFMDLMPSILGEAWEDSNTLYFIHYMDWIDENSLETPDIESLNEESPYWNHDYHELACTFDDLGNISYMQYAQKTSLDPAVTDTFISRTLQVHDTAPYEIAELIASQNVSNPPVFSWEEDREYYARIGITRNYFVNTEAIELHSIQAVIDRARLEADPREYPGYREGYDYNMATVSFDPDAKMWKVHFFHSQDETFCLIVFLNTDGITQMIVFPEATRE